MKYIEALVLSAMFFFAMTSPPKSRYFLQKLLYNKETPEKEKKRDFKIGVITWAIAQVPLFIYVIFFVD